MYKKIIIRSPNWVGDMVMATPAFRCIRENFPESEICLVTKPYVQKVVEGAPWFDKIMLLENGNTRLISAEFSSVVRRIRSQRYDLGFLFPNSFSSALLFWLGGVKRRIGYKRDARSLLLTDRIPRLSDGKQFLPTYMGDYYLRLCEEVGCTVHSRTLELFISGASRKKVEEILKQYSLDNGLPLFLFNPGAAYGSSKCWTAEGFARTAELIRAKIDCNIAIVGSPAENEMAVAIERAAKTRMTNLTNQIISLDVLKALIERCNLLLTVDSGPRHIAVALKRPVITLMGPNDPRYTDSSSEIGLVIRADVDCLACHRKVCPKDHRCMREIKPERVATACLEFLDDPICGRKSKTSVP